MSGKTILEKFQSQMYKYATSRDDEAYAKANALLVRIILVLSQELEPTKQELVRQIITEYQSIENPVPTLRQKLEDCGYDILNILEQMD